MDVNAIRKAIANAVGSIAGVQVLPVVPDSITPPAFGAGEVEIDYNQTFQGTSGPLNQVVCKGRMYVARAADVVTGQANLDAYLAPSGASSVKAAIERDRTLGGVCATLIVERLRGYGLYTVGGVDYYGAEFDIRVWAV